MALFLPVRLVAGGMLGHLFCFMALCYRAPLSSAMYPNMYTKQQEEIVYGLE